MAEALRDYFDGRIAEVSRLPWDWLDFGRLTALERRVLFATARIPPGHTLSYKELAESVERPRAYRFVGTTMAKNPFPVVIPCHRVIRSDQSVGKFGGGSDMKRKMIEMEATLTSRTDI
jgi:methylated-DNA-[protein]-cysteine S-methyltransferase